MGKRGVGNWELGVGEEGSWELGVGEEGSWELGVGEEGNWELGVRGWGRGEFSNNSTLFSHSALSTQHSLPTRNSELGT
uniref:Uncharacterized protein n=1 Tax=Desertifilum tharense IPPAS B-1220 TaxID=1781255 RepID=A0ACD5H1B2_9CYAN